MRKICFLCNFDKTPLFMALAPILQNSGVEVFWIVFKNSQYKELVQHFPENTILYLNRSYAQKGNTPIGSFKLNEIIYGDRILKHEPGFGYKFLNNIQKPIYDFIKNNKIGLVFGEPTQGYELLICRMCKTLPELNCIYIASLLCRIPDNRFFFFTDEKLSEVLEIKERKQVEVAVSEPLGLKNVFFWFDDQGI